MAKRSSTVALTTSPPNGNKRVAGKQPPAPLPVALEKLRGHMDDERMKKFLKGIGPAVAMGGIEEFNSESYKASMKICKTYTCVLPVTCIIPWSTSHVGIFPSEKQLEQCQEAYWTAQNNSRADWEGPCVVICL